MGQRIEQVGRVELWTHHQLRARQQRTEQHGAQAEDVGHRHERIASILGAERAGVAGHAGEMDQGIVSQHHALRLPRGARREDQRGDLVAQWGRLRYGVVGHRGASHAGQRRRQGAMAPGMRAGCPRRGGGEVHDAGLGLRRESVDLGGGHACIDAARPRSHAAAGQDQRGMFRTILGNHHHAVAHADAQRLQLRLRRVGQPPQVGERQAAAVLQMDEGPIGRLGQPVVKQMVDSRGHAGRPLHWREWCAQHGGKAVPTPFVNCKGRLRLPGTACHAGDAVFGILKGPIRQSRTSVPPAPLESVHRPSTDRHLTIQRTMFDDHP